MSGLAVIEKRNELQSTLVVMAQLRAQEIVSNRDVVSELINKSFMARGVAEQRLIIQQNRPQPKHDIRSHGRAFRQQWYEKKDWLCGSEVRQGLFCWPCLLFKPGVSSTWTLVGYKNMQGFLSDCQKHEKAKSHMEAYKMLNIFDVSERVDVIFSRARREEIERFYEEVRQNRVTLKILSEAVLYLGKQELSFRGHDESSASVNKGNYRELLGLIAKFDPQFERRLHGRLEDSQRGAEGGGAFTGVSSDIQNDIIECVDSVTQDEIDKEIAECNFLSIQVDKTADISGKEQLSLILRFDRKGEVVERFLTFFDVSSDRSAPAISSVVKQILRRYGDTLKDKLIMQTYDGASVMSGHISGVQRLLCKDYPFAYFFHCAAHRLSLVLCQSASSIPAVKVFFANVSAFSSFTSMSSKRKELFRKHVIEIPQPGDTRWFYRSRTVGVIFEKYQSLLTALQSIVENPQPWDDVTLSMSSGLLQHLNGFLFRFLIALFNKLFQQSSILYMVLQNRKTDLSYGIGKIISFLEFLGELRSDKSYDEFFASVVQVTGEPYAKSDMRQNYRRLFLRLLIVFLVC